MILAANHVNDHLDARVCHSLQKMLLWNSKVWPENPKKHHVEIIALALNLRIKCFSCNLIYPKSPRLKKRASRKHFEASVEKREPRGTFLSLGLRPRLRKPFPRFPFFYLGFKNLLLAALFSTSITWEKPNYTWNTFP